MERPGLVALGLAAAILLIGLACRDLLRFQPRTSLTVSLTGEVEQWFFEPADTSPLLVLILCGWLLWRRRRRLAPLWGQTGPVGVTAALGLAAVGIFAWAVRSGAPDLQALALVPLLLAAANLLAGAAAVRVVAFPAAILVFAVPVPAPWLNEVVWRLQLWTANYTGVLLHALGFPALVSGDLIYAHDNVFAIIETCSGQRSVETLTLLAVLMVDLFGRRGWHAAALLAAAPPVAFAVNGARALGLIFNPHSDIAEIHSLQGIAMLLGGVLVLYAGDGLLERLLPARPGISEMERRAREQPGAARPLAPRVAGLVACACGLLALSWLPRFDPPAVVPHLPNETLAHDLGGWRSTDIATDWLFLGKAAFGQSVRRRYVRGGEQVEVFVGQGDLDERLRSYWSPKTGYPGSGWLEEEERPGELAGRDVTLRVLRHGTRRLLVAHWYQGTPGLAWEGARALLALDAGPLRRRRLPLTVFLATPLASAALGAERPAEARLERFARLLQPSLKEMVTPRENGS